MKQYLNGGRTCGRCGFDLDKWGRPLPGQILPDKWARRLSRAPREPIEQQPRDVHSPDIRNDLHREDYHD
jgi:hypothetical protein